MAYKRTFKRKMRTARRGYKKARRTYKKAYRKSLGFGRKASNTMPKVKNRLGIFDNELYANMSVVDMLQDRLLAFAPLMTTQQLRAWDHNSIPGGGTSGGLLTRGNSIPAKRICPFLVIRLNCARDPYHSVAAPWDAFMNITGAPWNSGVPFLITDDVSQKVYFDKYQGLINGQPTFSLLEGGEDPPYGNVNSKAGYFAVTNGLADNLCRPNTDTANWSYGPFIPYTGTVPQGYVKAAQAYSRALVYESTLSVTIMNSSPIAKRHFDKSKTVPSGRHGMTGDSDRAAYNLNAPKWSYTNTDAGVGELSSIYDTGAAKPTGTTAGYFEFSPAHNPQPGWATPLDSEGYYSPIGIAPYGPVVVDPGSHVITNCMINLILTEDCCTSDPRFLWFGVTARKNFTSDKQSSTVIPLSGNLPEYPAGIPSHLEDHQLGQETTYMLVNITDSAPAATITKTYVLKDWLGTSLTDSQHGFYTAFPSVTISQTNTNRRQFFPAQGLYAIVWVAPAIRTGTLFSQTVYGTSPYTDEPFVGVLGNTHQGVNNKMGYQHNTGYSDFFCCHSRIDMKTKFYEPRSLRNLQANAAAGDIGSILVPYDNPEYV